MLFWKKQSNIEEIYLLVHPDFFTYSVFENEKHEKLLINWENEIKEKSKNPNIFFGLFLSSIGRIYIGDTLSEILNKKAKQNNILVLGTNWLNDASNIYNSPHIQGYNKIASSPENRINDHTILTARGIYANRCVLDHMLAFNIGFKIPKKQSFIDGSTSAFSNDSKILYIDSPYKNPLECNKKTLELIDMYAKTYSCKNPQDIN